MPLFAYKGRDTRGDLVRGTLDGSDSGAIADQLVATGVTPTEIRPSDSLRASISKDTWLGNFLRARKVEPLDLMLFSRQMYTLLKAGVPIMRALAGLQESSQNPAFIAMLQYLRESLDKGQELSISMRRHPKVFSPFYISMVQVGEMTGMLDEIFLRLYTHLEFEKRMSESIRGAMRYPMFVLIAMAIALVIVNIFVIPAFVKVFASFHAELPLMTRMLIGFSNFMVNFWPLLLALLIGAVMGFRVYVGTVDGKYWWDKYKLQLPIAGKIMFKGALARFARSLALAFKSGSGMSYVFVINTEP